MTQALDEKIALLRSAITQLKPLTAVYNGHQRAFCPHILGTKLSEWKVFGWQFDGTSSKPDELPTWRDFTLQKLHEVTLQDGEWHRGWVTGQREQRAIDVIDTVVDPAHAAEVRNISAPRIPVLGIPRQGLRR